MPGAGTRRRHDIIVGLEQLDDLAGNCRRVRPEARIVGGLAAAGLALRDLDFTARILQQLEGPRTRPKAGIDRRCM